MTTDDRRHEQPELDAELRARMDAYAAARLAPDPATTARARAAVLAEARRRAAGAASAPVPRRPRFRLALGPGLLAAAVLVVLLGVGGVLAMAPGGPLYPVRLWAEGLALPAEPAARAEAMLARLDHRLAEAEQAGTSGNGAGAAAALEAYRGEAGDALAAAGSDPGRRAALTARLETHRVVLATLAGRLPERAAEAILANLARTEARILEILGATPRPGEPGAPAQTPAPHKTPPGKPEATPAAQPTPEAATPTPKPGKTPPGKPDETPDPVKTPPGKQEASPTP